MKVLIVEDDFHKLQQLEEFVKEALSDATVISCKAYQSGLKHAVEWGADIIVLDMSLPTFEITASESGGRNRPYGGRDMLYEIARNKLRPQVIVVTGLPTFGEGEEKMSLEELVMMLRREFADIYRDTIYYHPSESEWRSQLTDALIAAAEEVDGR